VGLVLHSSPVEEIAGHSLCGPHGRASKGAADGGEYPVVQGRWPSRSS